MLDEAKAPLQAAADLDKTSADPYAWLIHAELGGDAVRGSGERDKVKSLFRAAIGRSPLHWPAHYKYFVATTEKWGGSHSEMFGFVRAVSSRSPRGNLVHCLVAQAYTEYALAAGAQGRQAIRTRQCALEVAAALYAWLDAGPATLAEKLLRAGSPCGGVLPVRRQPGGAGRARGPARRDPDGAVGVDRRWRARTGRPRLRARQGQTRAGAAGAGMSRPS
jgi:hypothetical protein